MFVRVTSEYRTILSEQLKRSSRFVATACRIYDAKLHRFLIRQLQTRQSLELADDIAQEVYLRLLRFQGAELVQNPQAYLYRIARNVLADRLQIEHRMRQRVVFTSDICDVPPHGDDEIDLDLTAEYEAPSPSSCEDTAAYLERNNELEDMLASLPPLQRAVLLMRKSEGMSYHEIAGKLQISVHTVKKYVHLALVQCRLFWLERQ